MSKMPTTKSTTSAPTNTSALTSRREFLGRAMVGLAVVGVGGVVAACGGDEPEPASLDCSNPPGLTDAQRAVRTNLGYVEATTDATKACLLCNFYTAAAPGQCGECTLNMGAVNPAGSCNSFAPRAS